MHEFGMCEGVVDAVERRAAGRRVAGVGVRVGALHRVVPDAFRQAFAFAAGGTVAAGADVELVVVPVSGRCRDCGTAFEADEPAPACPSCASLAVDADGGDDVVLEWLRYRDTAEGR